MGTLREKRFHRRNESKNYVKNSFEYLPEIKCPGIKMTFTFKLRETFKFREDFLLLILDYVTLLNFQRTEHLMSRNS
jgi:hypothetical protein